MEAGTYTVDECTVTVEYLTEKYVMFSIVGPEGAVVVVGGWQVN